MSVFVRFSNNIAGVESGLSAKVVEDGPFDSVQIKSDTVDAWRMGVELVELAFRGGYTGHWYHEDDQYQYIEVFSDPERWG